MITITNEYICKSGNYERNQKTNNKKYIIVCRADSTRKSKDISKPLVVCLAMNLF